LTIRDLALLLAYDIDAATGFVLAVDPIDAPAFPNLERPRAGAPRIRSGRVTQRLCGGARARQMEIGESSE